MYIYPDNLKEKATMWLWSLKDLAIVGIIILFSVFAFAYAGVWFPLVIAGAYAMLFNILSYMSNELLTNGYTAASIDEFYLFLTNLTAVEYIRNFMKRVRKKESAVILASQNLEDFNIDGIREYTKPLFSIPTHAFLFNAGNIDAKFYIDTLQLEKSEYNLIRYPQRGVCLYKCGNERYNLMVHAPEYKEKLFGNAGGR